MPILRMLQRNTTSLIQSENTTVFRDIHLIPRRYEPCHEVMALSVLRKLILQTSMRSHPVGQDVWFLVGPFVCFHTSCMQTATAQARLRGCKGSPEPSLFTYVISTIISWAGSYGVCIYFHENFDTSALPFHIIIQNLTKVLLLVVFLFSK